MHNNCPSCYSSDALWQTANITKGNSHSECWNLCAFSGSPQNLTTLWPSSVLSLVIIPFQSQCEWCVAACCPLHYSRYLPCVGAGWGWRNWLGDRKTSNVIQLFTLMPSCLKCLSDLTYNLTCCVFILQSEATLTVFRNPLPHCDCCCDTLVL